MLERYRRQRSRQQLIAAARIANPVRRVSPHWNRSPAHTQSRLFVVREVFDDHLECSYLIDDTASDDIVLVLKPPLLQRTRFDGKTRHGVTYQYVSASERDATINGKTYREVIVASYQSGDFPGDDAGPDIIRASAFILGGTPQAPGYNSGDRIAWMDDNVDGRHWAWENADQEG